MTIPNMVTTSKAAGEILSVRLKSLIGESNLRGAPMRIEKDAARRNLSITHSTLQRMLTGEGAHLDKLEDVAAYFGVSVWELLHPESSARSTPTLAQALEVVLDAMAQSTAKAELKQLLPMLVETNAAAYRARLGELLGKATDSARKTPDPQDMPPQILPDHQAEIDARVIAAQEQHEQQKHSRSPPKKHSA